jgi:hypothetical protein
MFTSCSSEATTDNYESVDERNEGNSKISITEGIWGTVLQREGNCMPFIGGVNPNPCKIFPVEREIWVYEYAIYEKDAIPITFVFYEQVNTKFVSKTTSDEEGFFELELKPGKYSVFVIEKGLLYARGSDGYGGICPVTVEMSKVTERKLEINYAID